jgi:hypothetical protein
MRVGLAASTTPRDRVRDWATYLPLRVAHTTPEPPQGREDGRKQTECDETVGVPHASRLQHPRPVC